MNNALKFLLFAAGCAIVVLLITVGVKTANKGKEDIESNVGQYSEAASKYEDIAIKVYDQSITLGSEVKRLIADYADNDYLSIKVINGKTDTEDYIHASTITSNVATIDADVAITASTDPADDNYINDAGTFYGEVFYDQNGVVACLQFKQQ